MGPHMRIPIPSTGRSISFDLCHERRARRTHVVGVSTCRRPASDQAHTQAVCRSERQHCAAPASMIVSWHAASGRHALILARHLEAAARIKLPDMISIELLPRVTWPRGGEEGRAVSTGG